jgi:hypothetical protein
LDAFFRTALDLPYFSKPNGTMKQHKNRQVVLLGIVTTLLSSCQGVHNLFKAHLGVGIIIVLIIVLLITGVVIKLSAKKPE